jgi:hypothetical protein
LMNGGYHPKKIITFCCIILFYYFIFFNAKLQCTHTCNSLVIGQNMSVMDYKEI